jgi:hypothetical protein
MSLDIARQATAKRTGKTIAQDVDEIDAALLGAIQEYGIHVDVPAAQQTTTKTIAAGINYIAREIGYTQIKSIVYRYVSASGNYQTVPLTGVTIAELDRANAGLENTVTDNISMFAVYGDKVLVGPGSVQTGGTLVVRNQNTLSLDNIDDVPNLMAIVNGAVANLLPESDEKQAIARNEFKSSWKTEGAAAQPIQQSYSEVVLPANILADDCFRGNL